MQNTEKEIKLKNGKTLPAGLHVSFKPGNDMLCTVHADDRDYLVRATSAFERPTMEDLEEMVGDAVVNSVFGNPVEPDGHDEHGAPSWLLALGMI